MTIFSSKVAIQLPTESLWDYVLGTEGQTRSQAPTIFDVDDPDALQLSAADVAMHARRFAETLTAAGVRPADRILFVYPASIYSAPFFLANYLIGATFIPLSAEITPSELQVIFEHSKPAAIVFQPSSVGLGRDLEVSSELPSPALLCFDSSISLPSLRSAPERDPLERNSNLHTGTQRTRSASSPCLILYTSGTSGKPKGWVYSEETLLAGTAHLLLKPIADEADFDERTSVGEWYRGDEATVHDEQPDRNATQTALRSGASSFHRCYDAVDLLAVARAGVRDARLQCKGPAVKCEGMQYQRCQNSRVDRARHVTPDGSN
jgi:acyl-CoA synthetase (AMP-forming)/AMP-acid ligase II